RQFFNFMAVGAGAGVLLLATTWVLTEKLEVTKDHFRSHTAWVYDWRLPYADVAEFRLQQHFEVWRKRPNWTSLHYVMQNGREGTFTSDTYWDARYTFAWPYLVRYPRAAGVTTKP